MGLSTTSSSLNLFIDQHLPNTKYHRQLIGISSFLATLACASQTNA